MSGRSTTGLVVVVLLAAVGAGAFLLLRSGSTATAPGTPGSILVTPGTT